MSVRIAKKMAELSPCRHRLGAVVIRQGKVVGRGFNKGVAHIAGPYHCATEGNPLWKGTIHAEVSAILHATHRTNLAIGSDLLVVRVGGGGRTRLARPCNNCLAVISEAGIRNVFYSTNDDRIERMEDYT